MKKYWYAIFLFLVILIVFVSYDYFYSSNSWSSNFSWTRSSGNKNYIIEKNSHLDFEFPWKKENLVSYEKPIYKFDVVYGEVLSDPEWTHLWEVSRRFDEENQQWFAKIQGYAHYFTFLDFGVEIWTNNPYDEDFVTKNPEIFRRYSSGNYDVLYTMWDFYVQRFEKERNQKFDSVFLNKNHAVSWCIITTYSSPSWNPLNIPKNYILYSLDFTQEREFCDFSTNNVVYFVYNPQRPKYYYKLSWGDGCAPSCGIPASFKIL